MTIRKTILRSKNFQVPFGNAKCVELFKFQNDAPILKYCQKTLNSGCFSSLASAFASIKHFKAAIRLPTSIFNDYSMRIDIALAALKCLILAKSDAKLLKQQLFNVF